MRHRPVILIESSPVFRLALTSVLHQVGLSVTALNSADLDADQTRPRALVLFDVATFPGGLNEIEQTVEACSRTAPVLLLGREDRLEEVLAGLKAGAVGFVQQTASRREMQSAVRTVASGHTFCDRGIFQRIMKLLPEVAFKRETHLTKREEEVLRYLSTGRSNKEIAQSLSLSEQSVKVHVSNLFRKTGTTNRSSLALFAATHGFAGGGSR
jgi:DNA-binding NarL/FixJ family response regulator